MVVVSIGQDHITSTIIVLFLVRKGCKFIMKVQCLVADSNEEKFYRLDNWKVLENKRVEEHDRMSPDDFVLQPIMKCSKDNPIYCDKHHILAYVKNFRSQVLARSHEAGVNQNKLLVREFAVRSKTKDQHLNACFTGGQASRLTNDAVSRAKRCANQIDPFDVPNNYTHINGQRFYLSEEEMKSRNLIYGSGSDVRIFTTNDDIERLKTVKKAFIDGTFNIVKGAGKYIILWCFIWLGFVNIKIIPIIIANIYVSRLIAFKKRYSQLVIVSERVFHPTNRKKSIAYPLIFFFVPDKSKATYKNIFDFLDQLVAPGQCFSV